MSYLVFLYKLYFQLTLLISSVFLLFLSQLFLSYLLLIPLIVELYTNYTFLLVLYSYTIPKSYENMSLVQTLLDNILYMMDLSRNLLLFLIHVFDDNVFFFALHKIHKIHSSLSSFKKDR